MQETPLVFFCPDSISTLWVLDLPALGGLMKMLMTGPCPLTEILKGQHDVSFYMEKDDTPVSLPLQRRKELILLLESKYQSGIFYFFLMSSQLSSGSPYSALQEPGLSLVQCCWVFLFLGSCIWEHTCSHHIADFSILQMIFGLYWPYSLVLY